MANPLIEQQAGSPVAGFGSAVSGIPPPAAAPETGGRGGRNVGGARGQSRAIIHAIMVSEIDMLSTENFTWGKREPKNNETACVV